jgi:sec-independent protein translocase protein TatA
MLGKFEELVVILVIVLVLFGGKKLPQLARGIGESVSEVRKGFRGETDEPKPAATTTTATDAKTKA